MLDARANAVGALIANRALDAAEYEAEEIYRLSAETCGARSLEGSLAALTLGKIALERGKLDVAEARFREAADSADTVMRPGHPHRYQARMMLATVLEAQHRPLDALEQACIAHTRVWTTHGRQHPHALTLEEQAPGFAGGRCLNRVINRPGNPWRHVVLDAEGYRERREASLASMARPPWWRGLSMSSQRGTTVRAVPLAASRTHAPSRGVGASVRPSFCIQPHRSVVHAAESA